MIRDMQVQLLWPLGADLLNSSVSLSGKPSAAQNGTVIQTCGKCGAINQSGADKCCFCHARLDASVEPAEVSASSLASGSKRSLTLGPDWRSEVSQRIRSYRERRRKPVDSSQSSLLFGLQINEPQNADQQDHQQQSGERVSMSSQLDPDDTVDEPLPAPGVLDDDQYEDPLQATLAAASARIQGEGAAPLVVLPAPEVAQPLLIDVSVPPIVEPEPSQESLQDSLADISVELNDLQDSQLFPVAELSLRRRAGAVDAVCLLLAFASVLALYAGVGGRLVLGRLDALVYGAILGLLYVQYFTLFTMMGGATPGMMLMGLRPVSFEGASATPGQLMWRSLGYLISGATALMGFLWAFWDEDHLSWHDRLSRTYITSVEVPVEAHSSASH
ncbi:MAG TPA: RDD family protein [Candidatus Acidoferrales bacterium]|nr:RDD family protein [Candidatus Acidoferrales bacterium]